MLKVDIGKEIEMNVDTAKLGFAELSPVMSHVVYMGLRNILMDSHASVTAKKSTNVKADSEATAQKKLDALYRGDVRTVSTRVTDSVLLEGITLATAEITKQIVASGGKASDYKAKDIRAAAIELYNARPDLKELAQKRADELKAAKVATPEANSALVNVLAALKPKAPATPEPTPAPAPESTPEAPAETTPEESTPAEESTDSAPMENTNAA